MDIVNINRKQNFNCRNTGNSKLYDDLCRGVCMWLSVWCYNTSPIILLHKYLSYNYCFETHLLNIDSNKIKKIILLNLLPWNENKHREIQTPKIKKNSYETLPWTNSCSQPKCLGHHSVCRTYKINNFTFFFYFVMNELR